MSGADLDVRWVDAALTGRLADTEVTAAERAAWTACSRSARPCARRPTCPTREARRQAPEDLAALTATLQSLVRFAAMPT
jgi:hypothetical protein